MNRSTSGDVHARIQLSRAELLVAPEDVANRMGSFGKQPVGEADGLHRLAVEDRLHPDTGLLRELGENGFSEDLILGAVEDDDAE